MTVAVTVGGVRLCFVSDDPRSAGPEAAAMRAAVEAHGEGIAALVLDVPDVDAAAGALAGFAPVREADGVRLDPERCHGVPLTFRRGG